MVKEEQCVSFIFERVYFLLSMLLDMYHHIQTMFLSVNIYLPCNSTSLQFKSLFEIIEILVAFYLNPLLTNCELHNALGWN